MNRSEWDALRERALRRLREDLARNLVDADISEWLVRFNEGHRCVFTSSSCSGRLVVFRGVDLLDKRGAEKLWVEHDPARCTSVCRVLESVGTESTGNQLVWVSLQPPIMHFYAIDEEYAKRIVDCARASGFARACYRRERGGIYFVEVAVHDKLHFIYPIPCNLAVTLCGVLAKYKERLARFEECAEASISC